MSAPTTQVKEFPARFADRAWWIVLLAALLWQGVATHRRIERVQAMTAAPTWSVDAPARDTTSPSGYEKGQRTLIVPGHHNPSFWWIMEAQQSVAQGQFRIRHIDYDAQPDGRELRRTAPYRWWLITVGWLHGVFTGEPLGYAIERGTLLADPLLFALLLIGGAVYTARFVGPVAAIGFVLGGTALFPLAANFQPGAPDSHSLSTVLALGSMLPLVASARKRGHFIAAGIFGGLGLWTDAIGHAPVLLAVFLGALGFEFFRSSGNGPAPAIPTPWRAWALAGAVTVLGACLFEFAPHHFSWSLDSVHPLHALVWWGMGELLVAAGNLRREGAQGFSPRSTLLAGLAVISWPVVGHFNRSGALLASDFYARELANHPGGGFSAHLGAWLQQDGSGGSKWATLLPCVLLVFLLTKILTRKTERETRGQLVLVLIPAGFILILACFQLRWWNVFDVFVLVGLIAFLSDHPDRGSRWQLASLLLLFLPGLIVGFPPRVEDKTVGDITPLEAQAMIARDYAYWLNVRAGEVPTVVFSTPVFSSAVAYYGNFAVVTSSDGGNQPGHLTAVRIASAVTPQEGLILLNSRRITHVTLPGWDPMLEQLVRIGTNLSPDQPLPRGAFAIALRDWYLPMWLRPMDYLIPKEPGFQGFELQSFALLPEQEPDLGLSRLTDFFLDRGQLDEAAALRENLKDYPRSAAALGAMANVNFALRDRPRLMENLENLTPLLARRAARNLPVDRRISLADLLSRTKQTELAREQITACMTALDAPALRHLTPGSVVTLLMLSRTLNIPFPDKNLEAIALQLIPPAVRVQLVGS